MALVRGDDFYRVMDEDKGAALTPTEGVDLCCDWQRLRDEVLRPMRGGRPARFRPNDWAANRLSDQEEVIPAA